MDILTPDICDATSTASYPERPCRAARHGADRGGDELSDHRARVRAALLSRRAADRRAAHFRARLGLRLLDGLVRARGARERRRRGPSRRVGRGPVQARADAPRARSATAISFSTTWPKRSRRCARPMARSTSSSTTSTRRGYPASIDAILPKLRPGGVLIIDNLLWSGRILDPADQTPDTEGVRAVTRRIMESDDWIASIVPIRDGVLVAYRK